MIISKLLGGLGNQMFQYAAGKALALRHEVNIKVDTTSLKKDSKGEYTQRNFELSIFETPIDVATEKDLEAFKNLSNKKLNRYIKRKFPSFYSSLIVFESGNRYHKEFLKYPANTCLNGFWQSEKYFRKFEKEIRHDFTFQKNIIEQNQSLKELISKTQSVSIHVRRGDYVTNKNAKNFHGLCPLNYYEYAVKHIQYRFKNIELFVFSDDIEWCKQNFKFDLPINYVETNNAASDLYLMTQCKHNIIANSSFSWWGAWLNQNSEKIVIAPKHWFADDQIDTRDLILENWIRL